MSAVEVAMMVSVQGWRYLGTATFSHGSATIVACVDTVSAHALGREQTRYDSDLLLPPPPCRRHSDRLIELLVLADTVSASVPLALYRGHGVRITAIVFLAGFLNNREPSL